MQEDKENKNLVNNNNKINITFLNYRIVISKHDMNIKWALILYILGKNFIVWHAINKNINLIKKLLFIITLSIENKILNVMQK